jgi:hypothetical protein
MTWSPHQRLATGGAVAAVVVGLGCASAIPRAPDADVVDETPVDAAPARDQKVSPSSMAPDVSAPAPDVQTPEPTPPPPGDGMMMSNPAAVKVPSFPDRTCPVSAGASAAAINAAIDGCSGMGGGTVTFAPGTYSVGSIHLKSNVKLALNGATLRGAGTDGAEPYTTPIAARTRGTGTGTTP